MSDFTADFLTPPPLHPPALVCCPGEAQLISNEPNDDCGWHSTSTDIDECYSDPARVRQKCIIRNGYSSETIIRLNPNKKSIGSFCDVVRHLE